MTSSPTDAKLSSLARANRVLGEQLSRDTTKVPDPGEVILTASSSSSYAQAPNHAWTPFELRKTMMIPEELFSDFEPTKSTCAMGVFPQIDRAWIALNNKLFLWDYVTSKDSLQSFPDQPSNISCVGLVRPKPGIFIDSMQHLLVLCTQSTLIVLGLATPETPPDASTTSQEFTVYDTELRFPTENVAMTSIVSTKTGRAFMCGVSDGHLYELQYQATEGWFGGKSSLHNHSVSGMSSFLPSLFSSASSDFIIQLALDETRDLLYALTSTSNIVVFNASGQTTAPLQRLGVVTNLAKQAQMLCPPLGQTKLDVVSIHVMPASESSTVHLVASTATGVRLYFTTLKRSYGGYGATTSFAGAPSGLELIHVRIGPTGLFDPRSSPSSDNGFRSSSAPLSTRKYAAWQPTDLNISGYYGGMFLATQTASDDTEQDILLCTAPDLPRIANLKQPAPGTAAAPGMTTGAAVPYYGHPSASSSRPTFSETTFLLALTGKAWAIAHLPTTHMPIPPSRAGQTLSSWNELIGQFNSYSEQFLILTNDGLSVVSKRRPVDTLRDLIESVRRGSDESIITSFFEQYGRDQACAMCLALACANTFASTPLSQSPLSSSSAFSISRPQGPSSSSPDGSAEEGMAMAAKTLFYEFGQQPTAYPGTTTVTFSGRHEGFALYFSRVVRPIWKTKITKGPTNNQSPNISAPTLSIVQKDLQSLMTFLERNQQLFAPPGNYSSFNSGADGQQSAWKDEEVSVAQLHELLGLTIEAINFILLLIDYKLPDTIGLLEPAFQQKLGSMTWEELLTEPSGRDVGKALVTAVINQQISQQISIDAISEVLQARCPNFCSTDDVMMYKAVESLRRAKETRSPSERSESLRESLRLLLKSTRNLRSGLEEICADYRSLNFPDGAVLLPLQCAKDWDVDFQGRDFWASGANDQDPRKAAYELRLKCYDLILETLSSFDKQLASATNEASAEEAEAIQTAAYRLCLDAADPIFHSYLYDWFVANGRTDILLDIRSPFIEDYLRREPRTWQKCELLWQFYVSHGQFLSAAEALADLAEGRDFGMKLEKRIEYLSLAVGNAKSHQVSEYESGHHHQAPVEFLTDLDEKLEVANVQLEVYEIMKRVGGLGETGLKDVELLGTALLDITTLYHQFADPYSLYDMKLLILKVSDHRDPQVVASTWRAIFDSVETQTEHPASALLSDHIRRLGQKVYPSDIAFPCDLVCSLLEDFAWDHRAEIPQGWVPQTLLDANIPYEAIFEALYTMREAGQPPYHTKDRELFLITDITYLMNNWLSEALRLNTTSSFSASTSSPFAISDSDPSSFNSSSSTANLNQTGWAARIGRFPADIIDQTVSAYLELIPLGVETQDMRRVLGEMQRKIRSRF